MFSTLRSIRGTLAETLFTVRQVSHQAERVLESLQRLERGQHMAQEDIDRLKAALSTNTSAIAGVSALITDLAQRVRDAADDPEEIRALADELEQNNAALAKAVTDNTPGGTPI
jgi:uncharacterized protein YoxC